MLAGDLVLDEPDASYWLSGIAPVLQAADLAVAHLEVPHTDSTAELSGDVPAPGAPPENLAAIAGAGIRLVSLAGNHITDCGAAGIADTRRGLSETGVSFAGAGVNLAEARAPAVVGCGPWRVGLLSYNCVGPQAAWAGPDRAGCAWLPVDVQGGGQVAPAAPLGQLGTGARAVLEHDISALRQQVDFVLVALHKGIVHTPAVLAPYEREVGHAAIDAGADVVIGHHAHIARGIELYRGKPIFHGLGNGCVVTRALSPAQDHPARSDWAERRKKLFGFEPDPQYFLAPFHPEAVNAFLGRVEIDPAGAIRTAVVPVHVEPPGRPVLAQGTRRDEIARYLEHITTAAGLPPVKIGADGMVCPA